MIFEDSGLAINWDRVTYAEPLGLVKSKAGKGYVHGFRVHFAGDDEALDVTLTDEPYEHIGAHVVAAAPGFHIANAFDDGSGVELSPIVAWRVQQTDDYAEPIAICLRTTRWAVVCPDGSVIDMGDRVLASVDVWFGEFKDSLAEEWERRREVNDDLTSTEKIVEPRRGEP